MLDDAAAFFSSIYNIGVQNQSYVLQAVNLALGGCKLSWPTKCNFIESLTNTSIPNIQLRLTLDEYVSQSLNLPTDFPIAQQGIETINFWIESLCQQTEDLWGTAVYYSDLVASITFDDQKPLIQNDIEVEYQSVSVSIDPDYVLIGRSMPRGNTEDIISNDKAGIPTPKIYLSDDATITNIELENRMASLVDACCLYNPLFSFEALEYFNEFKINNSTTNNFSSLGVAEEVANSNNFINYAKIFGYDLQQKIIANNGLDASDQVLYLLNNDGFNIRPSFGDSYHYLRGLKISINDTEETNIYIDENSYLSLPIIGTSYTYWEANFCFVIKDHYGIDEKDVLKYQGFHTGFAAWWILQHKRNYKPFVSENIIYVKLSGVY